MRDWLLLGLEYDRWANRIWEVAMGDLGIEEQARPVMSHIYAAQERWLQRLGVQSPTEPDDLNRTLLELAHTRDLNDVIDYRNTKGLAFQRTLQEILLHVINHGTYHRGQIRGLVPPAKTELIPDTDILYFLLEQSGKKVN